MIKEARGFGSTIDEAREDAIEKLGAAADADLQFEVVTFPKKKTLGLFGGCKAEVRVFVELPDEKPKAKKAPKKAEKKAPQENKNKEKTVKKEEKPEIKEPKNDGFPEAVDADSLDKDSRAAKAVAYIRTVLSALKCGEVNIKVAEKENAALISLDGEDLGVVIGRRGETLDALQYLAGLDANNGGGYYKVTLNIGNYREKREDTLRALAKRVSEQVIKTGRSRALEPMNPYERRIIRTAVQEIEGVVSGSFGEGEGRRVVIGVEGQEIRPPRFDNHRRDRRGRNDRGRRPSSTVSTVPAREPKKDSDIPLYGKIN